MKPFTYQRVVDPRDCVGRAAAVTPNAKFISGGTNLLDLMKLGNRAADTSDRYKPAAL